MLLASEQVLADVSGVPFLGELSLNGSLRHLQRVVPMGALARDHGIRTVYLLAEVARPQATSRSVQLRVTV
jgi:magnesium chelatase family protein